VAGAAARARGACLPWRRGSWVQVLACPGGTWSERSCLPWKRVLGLSPWSPWRRVWCAMVLLAREEDGPSVLAGPGGGGGGRDLVEISVGLLLAREEGPGACLACPRGEEGRDLVRLSVGLLLAREEGWCADGWWPGLACPGREWPVRLLLAREEGPAVCICLAGPGGDLGSQLACPLPGEAG
jgi:hypothetical protein